MRFFLLVQISDSGQVRVDDDGRLIIYVADRNNSGTYTCVAENVAGRTEKSFEMVVTSKFFSLQLGSLLSSERKTKRTILFSCCVNNRGRKRRGDQNVNLSNVTHDQ